MSDAERQYVAEYAQKSPSGNVGGLQQMYASGASGPTGDHIKVHQLNEGPGSSVGPSPFLTMDSEVIAPLKVKSLSTKCELIFLFDASWEITQECLPFLRT